MDFQFAAWERLTEEVTDGDADRYMQVERREWLIAERGPLIWARRLENPAGDCNYLVRPVVTAASSLGNVWLDPTLDNASEFFRDYHRQMSLTRVWQLDENSIVIWTKDGEWQFVTPADFWRHDGHSFAFWPSQIPPRRARSSDVWEQLQQDCGNPKTALAALVAHFALTEKERRWRAFETRIGTPQEFAELVEMALRAFHPHWPAGVTEITLQLSELGLRQGYYHLEHVGLGVRERAILGHLTRKFEPRLREDDAAPPEALRSQSSWSDITVRAPSMHERMEAALQLRRWLETHWPEGVKHLGKVV